MTIYVKINGRLGNNLFQAAVGYALAKETNQNFMMVYNEIHWEKEYISYLHPIEFISRNNIPRNIRVYSEWTGNNCFVFNNSLKDICSSGDIFLDGWFQTEKYFKKYLPDLKKMFLKREVKEIDGYFIHVRRGDYVNDKRFDICSVDYYKLSLEHFPKNKTFYIVSDDIEYCKTLAIFQDLKNKEFVTLDTLDTLHLMAGCRGGICANSSFSWWGAYLGRREIVTMPRKWINNGNETPDVYHENAKIINF